MLSSFKVEEVSALDENFKIKKSSLDANKNLLALMHALDKSNKQIEEQVSRMETKIKESEAVNKAFKENKNITVLYMDALNNSNMNVKLKAFDELSKVLELKMVAHDALKDARNDLEIELTCIVKQVEQFVQLARKC